MSVTEADGPPSLTGGDPPGPRPAPPGPAAAWVSGVKATGKAVGNALALAAGVLPAALCWAEAGLSSRAEVFLFWGQALALVPGLPGSYLRRGFYRLTLRACSSSCHIGFLSHFSRRQAEVGRRVYIGCGVTIGAVSLGDGTLVGSRSSLLSGGRQHQLGPDGRLTPCGPESLTRVRIGEETWIGEAAVVMADVGSRCIVAAGSVVSSRVPDGCLVGGNPARFVRRTIAADPGPAAGP